MQKIASCKRTRFYIKIMKNRQVIVIKKEPQPIHLGRHNQNIRMAFITMWYIDYHINKNPLCLIISFDTFILQKKFNVVNKIKVMINSN